MLSLRNPHQRKEANEHLRHIINAKKADNRIDGINNVTVDPKTKKLTVTIENKTYILKEDV